MTPSIQIIGSKGGGGAESFFIRLTQALNSSGDKVTAIMPPDSQVYNALKKSINTQSLKMRGNWDLWSAHKIRQAVKQTNVPIVQTWMGRATRLTHLESIKSCTHIARLGGFYNLKGYRHADAWIGNTKGICDYLIDNGLPRDRVFHIYNFFEIPEVVSEQEKANERQRLNIEEDAIILFALGRLHTNKAFDVLLNALADLGKRINGKPCYLMLAGDGPLKEHLFKQAEQLGHNDQIKWLGWQEETRRYYQMADVFICPSRYEPLGNVVLEAWGNRVPVIAARSQGPLELINNGNSGLLVDIENSRQIADAIRKVLTDNLLSDSLVESGFQSLNDNFSKDKIVSQYQELYSLLHK